MKAFTLPKELYIVAECDPSDDYAIGDSFVCKTYAAAEKAAKELENDESSEDNYRQYIFKAVAVVDRAQPVVKKL
jgi:hypothetical protein